jgi:hypothetical protein
VIWCSSPNAFEQLHLTEFFERNTAPVGWRSHRFQPAVAFPAVLIAKHSQLPSLIPAQPVRAQQPAAAMIERSDRSFTFHCRPHQAVDIFYGLDLRLSNNAHQSQHRTHPPGSSIVPAVYNTVVLDARWLPFSSGSLKAIVMVDVLHHIPDGRAFLTEAERCLRSEGSIVMIEPWVSTWSRLVYTHLHHEPFNVGADDWTFSSAGPLSGANGALPWIIFQRDRHIFESEFGELQIRAMSPFIPFMYLLSRGVSMRQLMPAATFSFWSRLESGLSRWPSHWSMFALIHLVRR